MPSSVSPATRASSATRNRPYSLSLSPIFTARVRIATLWSLLPVKYCMAAPKFSGSLPDQSFLRHQRAEIARDRAHVAVRELEPGAGECIGELIRVFVEPPRDLLIGQIEAQRQIGRQHSGHALLRLVERVRYGCLSILGLPLFRSRRAGCQLPLVFE